MVCRSTPGNSAITTIARMNSNLHDVQVLSLFHEVRAEAPRTTAAPDRDELYGALDSMATRARGLGAVRNMTDRRRNDLINRIRDARNTEVDGRTYYAWRNIEQRATFARAAMETHFAEIARRHGGTPAQAEAAFNQMMHRDHRVDGEVPQAPEHVPFSTDNLPRDRGTRYALAMLYTAGPQVAASRSLQRGAYRRIHDDSEHIAHNPHLDPANQCPDCGQFAGANHTCPVSAADNISSDAAEHDWQDCLDCIEDGSNLHEHTYNPNTAATPTLSEEEVAAMNAQMEALYLRNQGYVPEETGTADREADAALDADLNSDGAPEHDDDCAEEIRNYGACRHGNAFPDQAPRLGTGAADPVERRVLTNEHQILHTARNSIEEAHTANGLRYVTPDGHAYPDRELAVRSAAAGLRHTELRNAIRMELGSADAADAHLDTARDRLDTNGGRWRTPDRQTFVRYEDAVLHDFYLQRDGDTRDANQIALDRLHAAGAEHCPQCGQFMGEGHVCDPETVAERRAALGDDFTDTPPVAPLRDWSNPTVTTEDPLAEWERELLDGPQPEAPAASPPVREPAAAPARRRNPNRSYRPDEDTVVRLMNVSAVRSALRDNPDAPYTLDDVSVQMSTPITNEFGVNVRQPYTVSGSMSVANTGQRRTRNRDRYEVTASGERSLRCTCADYRTNYDCEHVRQATEHVQALLNQRDPVAVAPAVAMQNVGTALRGEYDDSLAASQEARAEFAATGDDVSYAEDMSAFQSAWDEAKAHFESGETALPYMYENATNGLGAREGGRSIGIEIEVDFPEDMTYEAKHKVAREIYEAGLSDSDQVRPWHWRARQLDTRGRRMGGGYTDDPNMWSVEFDRSVDDVGGNRGCEIVSPILYDTPETWRNLKTVCDIIERNGGKVTPRTGLHINIGAADFDHTVGNHNRLIGIANAYEDVIVRTAHNPQSGPNHRGRDYCRPMEMPSNGFSSIRQAQRSIDPNGGGSSHRSMINLDHVPAEGAPVQNSTRVEVRIFDGSIDPGRIQANVKMSLGMVNAAVRGVDVPRDAERAGTHRTANVGANGRMRRLRGEDWERDTASFRQFADTLFSRAEDKKQLTYAFAASRWQRR